MPSRLAYRVLPTTRVKLRIVACRNERTFRTEPLQRHRRRSPNPLDSKSRARSPCSPRVRTTEHTRRRSAKCTRLPGRSTPRRAPNARWEGSHCQPLLQSGRTVSASLNEPLPPPAEPCGVAPEQAPVPCRALSRQPLHRWLPRSGVTTFARLPPRTLTIQHTLDITSTSKLLRSQRFRCAPYRLDTPPPSAVARRRRWLDSEGTRSPSQQDRECPALQASVGTLPRRCRRESILTDPAIQEARVPANRSEHCNVSRTAMQRTTGGNTSGIPRDPFGLLRLSAHERR